ncbi:adenosylcobinamide-GDP ribazoletransferase [Nakamurella endophytica]|uniref:Adenosylcobinamide-GDP ribazoletransferase n=1 Tax=Nakamurella endophytica TaxID=1748367 RepID=A0A917SJK6_9ACTN|nr:adenosylcobinamide-GDP ribazoletransferase [Nakamurella endophytica]GGL85164.1 adenosylcobinamide-GDP ribazoletransferase [Nakamurella endophytica]
MTGSGPAGAGAAAGGPRSVVVDGLRMAAGTFTAVPVRPPSRVDRPVARAAMLLAGPATVPLGVVTGLVCWAGVRLGLPSLLVAVLAVGVLALGDRGLHLDGLADTADGLAASYDRERALAVMRRGDTGPAGVVAVVLVLAAQLAGAAAVLHRPWGAVLLAVAVCVSRWWVLPGCTRNVPAARTGGLGAAVAGSVPLPATVAVLVAAGALLAAAAALTGLPWWRGALGAVLATVAAGAVVLRCRRRLGGVTGDVLGASVEVALAALLVPLAAG